MAQRGVNAEAIHQVVYGNALAVYGLNTEMKEEHWLAPSAIGQRTLHEGNSVLRSGQTPRIEEPDGLSTKCDNPTASTFVDGGAANI